MALRLVADFELRKDVLPWLRAQRTAAAGAGAGGGGAGAGGARPGWRGARGPWGPRGGPSEPLSPGLRGAEVVGTAQTGGGAGSLGPLPTREG